MSYDIVNHTRIVQELLDSGRSFVTVTLLAIRGSAPQVVGAKAIVTSDGIESGTVGGGKIEAAAIEQAKRLLAIEKAPSGELVTWNLQTDIGMTCGGEVKLFFEVHTRNAWPIVVFGAGHVAQTLVPLLLQLPCHVTCVDTRPPWLNKLQDHPKLTKRCTDEPRRLVAEMPSDAFFVLMSKGHQTDLPVLAEVLSSRDARYVGVIGSAQKASVLRRELAAAGISEDKISSFFCPIGDAIGNNTPIEISISVVAQLIRERDRFLPESAPK